MTRETWEDLIKVFGYEHAVQLAKDHYESERALVAELAAERERRKQPLCLFGPGGDHVKAYTPKL